MKLKIVHLLRSEPDEMVRQLINDVSKNANTSEIVLYAETINYARVVDEIFSSDRLISWW